MFANFVRGVKSFLTASQVIEDELLRFAYSTDASLYRMVPKLVLIVINENEVVQIINLARQFAIKLTFRAAGTSLSGQAVTDQVLLMLAKDSWLNYQILDSGNQIQLEPGIIGAAANAYLKAYNKQIGPDPGSINAAKIGGIIANNSSGMCCGTSKNSYATLKNLRAVLATGAIFDSSSEAALAQFKLTNPVLLDKINALRQKILNDEELVKFIRKKFSIKNTSGYSLNAFLDFADPIQILERLMVGSEGTLGFVSKVTLTTIPNYAHKALNLLYGNLRDLINLTVTISQLGVSSVELLDYFSLKSVAADRDIKEYLVSLPDATYAAIMIEVTAVDQVALQEKIASVNQVVQQTQILQQTGFIGDEQAMAALWKARSGVLPTIAALRPLGSSVLIEDVAVEIVLLPDLIQAIRQLFNKFGYKDAAIFGHVLAGNIHFVITPNFANAAELTAYDQFMHEFTHMVATKFNGSLKAEHGSGRNISPFAIVEWGEKCWNLMWEIKSLLDPGGMLNPDVKLTRDPTLHLQHLKTFAPVDAEINKCMECGFCEPVCPSRKLSLTPRQRNTVARHITTLTGEEKVRWHNKYQYYGISTCATTGMCKTVCPVGIDTGAFILKQKPSNESLVNHARTIKIAKAKVQLGNVAAAVLGPNTLQAITTFAHNKIKSIPIYLASTPRAQNINFAQSQNLASDIFLVPACPNRVFAADVSYSDYPSKLVLQKMGYTVKFLSDVQSACCGHMYHSQCNQTQQHKMVTDLARRVKNARIAIIDNSSCSGFATDNGIDLIDINKFIIANIDKSKLNKKYKKIALHIDCSTAKHHFNPDYLAILQLCSDEIVIPEGIKCCGFAGDKGFMIPELNASSLSRLASQIAGCEIGVTFNRSCQIGLTQHGKIQYISFVETILNCFVN